MLEACAGMMAKHTVSIYDMCGSEEPFYAEQWDEKITDHINYLILLRAIVYEMAEEEPEGIFVFDEMLSKQPAEENKPNPWAELNAAIHQILNPDITKKDI
jgi:hypothetical protein